MSANLLGNLANLLDDRVLVLLQQCITLLVRHKWVCLQTYRIYPLGNIVADAERLNRVLHSIAFGADQRIVARVWSRGYDVVVLLNNLAILGADKGCCLVAILEIVELLAVS